MEGKGRVLGGGSPDYLLSTQPNMGLNPTTMRSWPKQKPRVGHSTAWATQAPQGGLRLNCASYITLIYFKKVSFYIMLTWWTPRSKALKVWSVQKVPYSTRLRIQQRTWSCIRGNSFTINKSGKPTAAVAQGICFYQVVIQFAKYAGV